MPSATARTCLVGCWEPIRSAGEACGKGKEWEAVETCLRERCGGLVDDGQVRTLIDEICTKSERLRRAISTETSRKTSSWRLPTHENTRRSPSITSETTPSRIAARQLTPSSDSDASSSETPTPTPIPSDGSKGHVPITYVGIICGLSTFIMFVFILALLWHLRKKKLELRALDARIRKAKAYRNELKQKAASSAGGSLPRSPVSPLSSRSKKESIWVKLDEKMEQRAEQRAQRKTMRYELPASGGGMELHGTNGGIELPARPAVYYELEAERELTPPPPTSYGYYGRRL